MKKCALVLTGGGARGAYQAGAMSAVFEICLEHKINFPFKILSGISAGGINVSFLASKIHQSNLLELSNEIQKVWNNICSDDVFRTDPIALTMNGIKWLRSLSTGTLRTTKKSLSLLDTDPLRETLKKNIDFDRIRAAMENGQLESLSMNMVNYATGLSQTCFQSVHNIPGWERVKRQGMPVQFTYDHIMATSAIPLVFPPIKIGQVFYGDGSLRDYTPLSPPIKLGAEKLFVIGVRKRDPSNIVDGHPPTPAKILSIVLNGILLDALDTDLERLERINKTVALLGEKNQSDLRPIDTFVVTPSRMLSDIAFEESDNMPKTIQYLINGLGSPREAADLISYILFEGPYTRRLMELGRSDVFQVKDQVIDFIRR